VGRLLSEPLLEETTITVRDLRGHTVLLRLDVRDLLLDRRALSLEFLVETVCVRDESVDGALLGCGVVASCLFTRERCVRLGLEVADLLLDGPESGLQIDVRRGLLVEARELRVLRSNRPIGEVDTPVRLPPPELPKRRLRSDGTPPDL
jgi:hypothetical protein